MTASEALPAIRLPIVLDEKGYAYGLHPGDPAGEIGSYVHSGIRLGWAPLPLHGGLVLSLWGGRQADPGYEEEGVAVFISSHGLRRLAADLAAIADASAPA